MTDTPSNPNEAVQAYTLGDIHDRLQTIIDEHFGPHPTTPVDGLLDILERELNAQRIISRAVAEDPLEDKLVDNLKAWLERAVPPILAGTHHAATIKIRIGENSLDDEGHPYLSFGITERLHGPAFDQDAGGRVPGGSAWLKTQREEP